MKISHETPKCLMDLSRHFNDYDYALVHKYSEDPYYKQFFIDSIKMERKVILDNSLFELETMFDRDVFAQAITETLPTEYIVPDALEKMQETIDSFEDWLLEYNDLPGIKIGVVQGKTLEELVNCYLYMSRKADKIAISFDYSWYVEMYPDELTKFHSWMKGRQHFIDHLVTNNIINYNKPHHLLGCGLPKEFQYYKSYNFIETIDTSNPVVHAIKGIPYSSTGLEFKESMKLIELFDTPIENINVNILDHNVNTFRSFCS